MKSLRYVAAVGTMVLFLTACESILGSYDLGYQDAPSAEELEQNPTFGIVISAAQGLLDAYRDAVDSRLGGVSAYGREAYNLSTNRTILDEFDEPSSPAGGFGWSSTYTNIRTINTLLHALDEVELLSDAEKDAIRGWAITCEALLLHSQLRMQDYFGIVIDTDRERDEGVAPIATKAEAFTYILQRYDTARDALASGGTEFPFQLTPGFSGFDTPSTFIQVNRALKARALLDNGDYAGALTALGGSFLDTGADLYLGAWNNYSTSSGDIINPYHDPSGFTYVLDTNLVVDVQTNGAGADDLRLTNKTFPVAYLTHTGVTSNVGNGVHPENTSSIPIIRNEELILIRAEARWRTGDRPALWQT